MNNLPIETAEGKRFFAERISFGSTRRIFFSEDKVYKSRHFSHNDEKVYSRIPEKYKKFFPKLYGKIKIKGRWYTVHERIKGFQTAESLYEDAYDKELQLLIRKLDSLQNLVKEITIACDLFDIHLCNWGLTPNNKVYIVDYGFVYTWQEKS